MTHGSLVAAGRAEPSTCGMRSGFDAVLCGQQCLYLELWVKGHPRIRVASAQSRGAVQQHGSRPLDTVGCWQTQQRLRTVPA